MAWQQTDGIVGKRVARTGVGLDGTPIAIGPTTAGLGGPNALAVGAGVFLAVFETTGGDIQGARLNGSGTALDPPGLTIATQSEITARPGPPVVAFDGTNFFVLFTVPNG